MKVNKTVQVTFDKTEEVKTVMDIFEVARIAINNREKFGASGFGLSEEYLRNLQTFLGDFHETVGDLDVETE